MTTAHRPTWRPAFDRFFTFYQFAMYLKEGQIIGGLMNNLLQPNNIL